MDWQFGATKDWTTWEADVTLWWVLRYPVLRGERWTVVSVSNGRFGIGVNCQVRHELNYLATQLKWKQQESLSSRTQWEQHYVTNYNLLRDARCIHVKIIIVFRHNYRSTWTQDRSQLYMHHNHSCYCKLSWDFLTSDTLTFKLT
jgi:hypothetical protein